MSEKIGGWQLAVGGPETTGGGKDEQQTPSDAAGTSTPMPPSTSGTGEGGKSVQSTIHNPQSTSLSDLTSHCIRCGFCLESCPTYVLTGKETESPRGRIYLVRSADEGKIAWEAARPHLDLCVGCRACETACPSGVEYGKILELARSRLEENRPNRFRRMLLSGLARPKRLALQLKLGRLLPGRRIPVFVSRLLSGKAPEADKPRAPETSLWPPLKEEKLPPVRGEVYLLEGCAMRVLYPQVHEATRRLLRRVGFAVRPSPNAGCCGALHAHGGALDEASRMAAALREAMPDGLPIVANSAGCGSWLQEAGFRDRAVDASAFLAQEGLAQVLAAQGRLDSEVAYHDACHLAHGQGVRSEPRELLRSIPGLRLVELEEADRCCGSGGIYNLTQPEMARKLLERKMDFIEAGGAPIVATGNPGCHAWIAQGARERGGRIRVVHTLELLEESLSGSER